MRVILLRHDDFSFYFVLTTFEIPVTSHHLHLESWTSKVDEFSPSHLLKKFPHLENEKCRDVMVSMQVQ